MGRSAEAGAEHQRADHVSTRGVGAAQGGEEDDHGVGVDLAQGPLGKGP